MAYYRRLFARAWKETLAVWTSYRLWLSLSSPVAGILTLVARRGWREIMNAQDLIASGLAGASVGLVGSFVISLFRSPKLLDEDRVSEMHNKDSALKSQIEENQNLQKLATAPKISALEQERRDFVNTQLKDATADHIAVLKYILRQAQVGPAELLSGKLPLGLADQNAPNKILSLGILSGILSPASGGRTYISVKPEFLAALEFCLEHRPVTPPQGRP